MILVLTIVLLLVLDLSEAETVVLLVVACVLEAGEITALRRYARRQRRELPPQTPDEQLVGLIGEVVTPCRPEGQIRVRGETWAAVCDAGADRGASVRVESVDELTLRVAPAG